MRLSSIAERFRASLFLVPLIAVVTAIAVAAVSLVVDQRIDSGSTQLPLGLTSTVDSARALLSTVAGATITFAAIAFSISVLIIQQASNQYSPRVVHTLFRDPFNKRVMGLVVGTFTYCLIVLRSVRTALEEGGAPIIPNVSVAIAVVLGVTTILAIVAFINHSAHSMDISEILARVRARGDHAHPTRVVAQPDRHGPERADRAQPRSRRTPSTSIARGGYNRSIPPHFCDAFPTEERCSSRRTPAATRSREHRCANCRP